MNHAIKIARARTLSAVGRYPRTSDRIMATIPDSAIDTITARALADLTDSIRANTLRLEDETERKIVSEGFVWDARNQRIVEVSTH